MRVGVDATSWGISPHKNLTAVVGALAALRDAGRPAPRLVAVGDLYSTATAVVIPSLAEGFGLPAVEAGACQAPLILRDPPAHRETLDGAANFVPPTDEHRIAEAIGRVAGDAELRADLGARARRAVEPLSWAGAARALREVLVGARR